MVFNRTEANLNPLSLSLNAIKPGSTRVQTWHMIKQTDFLEIFPTTVFDSIPEVQHLCATIAENDGYEKYKIVYPVSSNDPLASSILKMFNSFFFDVVVGITLSPMKQPRKTQVAQDIASSNKKILETANAVIKRGGRPSSSHAPPRLSLAQLSGQLIRQATSGFGGFRGTNTEKLHASAVCFDTAKLLLNFLPKGEMKDYKILHTVAQNMCAASGHSVDTYSRVLQETQERLTLQLPAKMQQTTLMDAFVNFISEYTDHVIGIGAITPAIIKKYKLVLDPLLVSFTDQSSMEVDFLTVSFFLLEAMMVDGIIPSEIPNCPLLSAGSLYILFAIENKFAAYFSGDWFVCLAKHGFSSALSTFFYQTYNINPGNDTGPCARVMCTQNNGFFRLEFSEASLPWTLQDFLNRFYADVSINETSKQKKMDFSSLVTADGEGNVTFRGMKNPNVTHCVTRSHGKLYLPLEAKERLGVQTLQVDKSSLESESLDSGLILPDGTKRFKRIRRIDDGDQSEGSDAQKDGPQDPGRDSDDYDPSNDSAFTDQASKRRRHSRRERRRNLTKVMDRD